MTSPKFQEGLLIVGVSSDLADKLKTNWNDASGAGLRGVFSNFSPARAERWIQFTNILIVTDIPKGRTEAMHAKLVEVEGIEYVNPNLKLQLA